MPDCFFLKKRYEIKVPLDGIESRPYYGYQMKNGTWTDAMGLVQRKVLIKRVQRVNDYFGMFIIDVLYRKLICAYPFRL